MRVTLTRGIKNQNSAQVTPEETLDLLVSTNIIQRKKGDRLIFNYVPWKFRKVCKKFLGLSVTENDELRGAFVAVIKAVADKSSDAKRFLIELINMLDSNKVRITPGMLEKLVPVLNSVTRTDIDTEFRVADFDLMSEYRSNIKFRSENGLVNSAVITSLLGGVNDNFEVYSLELDGKKSLFASSSDNFLSNNPTEQCKLYPCTIRNDDRKYILKIGIQGKCLCCDDEIFIPIDSDFDSVNDNTNSGEIIKRNFAIDMGMELVEILKKFIQENTDGN